MNKSASKRKPRPRSPREAHSFSLHPIVRTWLEELAWAEYEGNISAAVTALIVYDRGVRNAKRMVGEEHHHVLTKGLASAEKLEAVLREIESEDPGFCARTWLQISRDEAGAQKLRLLVQQQEEEIWRLHATVRELRDENRELRQELERLRTP